MSKTIIGALSLLLVAAGCTAGLLDVNIEQFSRLKRLEDLDYTRISPGYPYSYWELRWTFSGGTGERVLGSGGLQPKSELNPALATEIDNARPTSGFFSGCLPDYCYTFIVAISGKLNLFTTRANLLEFLGSIDSVEEAALVAHSYNLHWDESDTSTGYREVSGGWEILALQLVKTCAPVQTDRVLLLVRRDGQVRELGREVHSRSENACV